MGQNARGPENPAKRQEGLAKMPPLKTQDLSVGYAGQAVVSGVTITAQPGKIQTLIGPNGAGKSTILKTITAQLSPVGGVCYISGRERGQWKESEIAQEISMVMTERIHPELMSCRDVVAMGRYPYTGRLGILSQEDWRRTDEALEAVRAADIADRDFSQVSDGQRQRIMIARALCQDTKIMILDEPTSYLDLHYKLDILSIIRQIAENRNIAVLMSLHELEFVGAISDEVICVDDGRISLIGSPSETLTAENIEKLYKMPPKSCKKLVRGLESYSWALRDLLSAADVSGK